jgi:AmmeMemoRadiSam system protein A
MGDVRGVTLLRLARHAIEASFDERRIEAPRDAWLQEPRAVFVSLHDWHDHALRGCVGSIEAVEPLGAAVVTAAVGAAFRDTRFAPLVPSELSRVRIDVSVLSPLEPLPARSEREALALLDRAKPGVVFRSGWRRSVLLPKVWESIDDAAEFLRHLKLKAGLPGAFWSDTVELSVFTCEEFSEADDRPGEAS